MLPFQGLEVRAAAIPTIAEGVLGSLERLGPAGALIDPIDFINAAAPTLDSDWMAPLLRLESLTPLKVQPSGLCTLVTLVTLRSLEVLSIATPARYGGDALDLSPSAEIESLQAIVVTGGAKIVALRKLGALPTLAGITLSRGAFDPGGARSLPLTAWLRRLWKRGPAREVADVY